jgi:hypothetical protein
VDTKIRFLVLMLAALLLAAGTAQAAGPAFAGGATTFEVEEEFEVIEEVEEDEGGNAAEECAEGEVESELGEIDSEELAEDCEAASTEAESARCPLRSAHAHAAINDNTIKVTLGYTAYEPFNAKLQLSSHLGTLKRRLSRAGVLRFTKQLGDKQPDKFVLRLRQSGRAGCPSPRLVLFPK